MIYIYYIYWILLLDNATVHCSLIMYIYIFSRQHMCSWRSC